MADDQPDGYRAPADIGVQSLDAVGPVSGGPLDPTTHPDQTELGDNQAGQTLGYLDGMPESLAPSASSGQRSYIWPVAGGGTSAVQGAIGPNGLHYANGQFSPDGSTRGGRPHYGIDLPATRGDTVSAAADGVVYNEGAAPGWGNYVAVRHPDGYVSVYAHLDSTVPFKPGDGIYQGQMVGTVGNTGDAQNYGTHLHLEVRKDVGANTLRLIRQGAQAVDPTAWINGTLRK